jgi:hypothetical protein
VIKKGREDKVCLECLKLKVPGEERTGEKKREKEESPPIPSTSPLFILFHHHHLALDEHHDIHDPG